MKKNSLTLSILLILFAGGVWAKNSENITVKSEVIGEMCFTTIDIQTTEEWLNKEYELIEFDSYPNIRRQGFIMDMFYSNAGFGKSQWTEMDTKGIYVQSPGTLYLSLIHI